MQPCEDSGKAPELSLTFGVRRAEGCDIECWANLDWVSPVQGRGERERLTAALLDLIMNVLGEDLSDFVAVCEDTGATAARKARSAR